MKIHLFHKWSTWGEPILNYNGRRVQYRHCTICNKANFRPWWDGQADLPEIIRTWRGKAE